MRSRSMIRAIAFLLALAGLAGWGAAFAFTFSDGTATQCVAGGKVVVEVEARPGQASYDEGRTAKTVPFGKDYQIVWNVPKFAALPPHMRDFLFFHECAHAQVPTDDEYVANCVGLIAMRVAGRAGSDIEAKLAAFFGAQNEYWVETLKCANASKVAPAGAGKPPS